MSGTDLDATVPAALCRRLVTVPGGIAAALIVGAAAALRWNASLPAACLAGALTLVFSTGTRERLETLFAAAVGAGDGGVPLLVALVSDLVVGGALGHVLGLVLDADAGQAVFTGAGLSAAWGLVVGQLFCGRVIDDVLLFVLGGGSGGSTATGASGARALAAAGKHEAALAAFEARVRREPNDPDAYLEIAWLLRDAGRDAEAIGWLRRARSHARLTPAQQILVAREIAFLAERIGEPETARLELDRLAQRSEGASG